MDSTSLPEMAQKHHQLTMLSDAITRAREAFFKSPGPDTALQLQEAHKQYRDMRALMFFRVVE